jgi:hypothetical protein
MDALCLFDMPAGAGFFGAHTLPEHPLDRISANPAAARGTRHAAWVDE